jgi:hypothetical protein
MQFSTWNIDSSRILSHRELATVLRDLKRRAARFHCFTVATGTPQAAAIRMLA